MFSNQYGHHSVTVDGTEYLPEHDEEALLKAVAHQPVTFQMDPGGDGFMFYKEVTFQSRIVHLLSICCLIVHGV